MMGADGFAVMRCVAVTGEKMIFADGNVQKIFVYFQNCLCALMGKIVEIQQVYRVKLSKSRTLGCIPVHPGRRCTAPDKP